MANESCSFVVKWAGNEYKVNVVTNGTVLCLKKEIENQTSVKINRQKLLNLKYKGALLSIHWIFFCFFPLIYWIYILFQAKLWRMVSN